MASYTRQLYTCIILYTYIRIYIYIYIYILCVSLLDLELQPGAAGFQLSNPPVLETVSLLASLNVSNLK